MKDEEDNVRYSVYFVNRGAQKSTGKETFSSVLERISGKCLDGIRKAQQDNADAGSDDQQ